LRQKKKKEKKSYFIEFDAHKHFDREIFDLIFWLQNLSRLREYQTYFGYIYFLHLDIISTYFLRFRTQLLEMAKSFV